MHTISNKTLFALLLTVALILPCAALAAQTTDAQDSAEDAAQITQLETLLREHPEVLMKVLRDNSEELFFIMREGSQKAQRKAITTQWLADLDVPKQATLTDRIIRGGDDAPVTIVAFSDFTCPYCEQAAFTLNSVLKHYGKTVRFVFKNVPLASHEHAREASEYFVAASMQDKEKAWQYYDAIFANRATLLNDGEAFLKDTAMSVGLDVARLSKDAKGTAVKAIVDQDIKDSQTLGFSGTPYFLVNNIVIRGAVPFDMFSEAIEMALDHANKKK